MDLQKADWMVSKRAPRSEFDLAGQLADKKARSWEMLKESSMVENWAFVVAVPKARQWVLEWEISRVEMLVDKMEQCLAGQMETQSVAPTVQVKVLEKGSLRVAS